MFYLSWLPDVRSRRASLDELVNHALRALKETVPAGQGFNDKNVSLGIVGIGDGEQFRVLDGEAVKP